MENYNNDTPENDDPVAYVVADIQLGSYTVKAFESFTMFQSTHTHHSFELVIAHDALLTDDGSRITDMQFLDNAGKLMGQPVRIGFHYNVWPDKKRWFNGIITNVGYRRSAYGLGDIVITGSSPTLLLDGAPHIQSFTGKNLSDITATLLAQGGVTNAKVKPAYTATLPYTCQYNETHYNYLARLAAHYGEWFYYDGEQLYFGRPMSSRPKIRLVLGRNVSSIDVQMNARHVMPQHYGYNSCDHQLLKPHTYQIAGMEQLGQVALQASMKMFQTPAVQVAPLRARMDSDITVAQKSAATASAAALFTVKGITTNPYLFPGCYVTLETRDMSYKGSRYLHRPDAMDMINKTEHYAELIITEMRQTLHYSGQYECEFTAVSSKTENLPFPDFTMPIAEPQLATVTDNKDDKGRVKVQFPWQEDPTDFIRVMTPDAGSSDKVGTNRGLVTIPEIGDQVLIGFMHSHPDRPFVMGGMFHGKAGGGGGTSNNVKSLTSKSGHTVRLDDGGGILVRDKNGNHVHVDGAGTITVTSSTSNQTIVGANEDCKEGQACIKMDNRGFIDIMAKSNFKITVGGDNSFEITDGGDGMLNLKSGLTIKIGNSIVTICKDGTINFIGKNIKVNGSSNVTINSDEVEIN